MRSKNRQWFLAWASPRGPQSCNCYFGTAMLLVLILALAAAATATDGTISSYTSTKYGTKSPHNESRGVFSPRMDYEQWTPLGMGDPLKNDPTYDYVPPVLERVHYWVDPINRKSNTTPHSLSVTEKSDAQQKTEILVLGVSSKKPSSTSNSSPSMHHADSKKDYESFFKYIDSPKYTINYQRYPRPQYIMMPSPSYVPSYYTNKNRIPDRIYPKRESNVPYTLLMPPPIPAKNFSPSTQTVSTTMATSTHPTTVLTSTSDVTVQQSNLIFHSTSVQNTNKRREESQQGTSNINHYTIDADSSSHVTWRTPHPNALPSRNMTEKLNRPAESFMQFQQMFASNPTIRKPVKDNVKIQHSFELAPIVVSSQREQIISPDVMHKGLVTDEAMDVASTYVNIGKPEAQMDSSALGISGVSMEPPKLLDKRPSTQMQPVSAAKKEVHTLQSMQIVQPQLMKTYRPPFSLQALLQKETTRQPILTSSTTTTSTTTSASHTTVYVTPSPLTSTTTTLTTDPIFRHYKQPSEPIRGPMYLIIQGHSKVKTYGPVKQIHGINIQEMNEIQTFDDKDDYQVKHLHHRKMHGLLDRRSNRGGREYPYNLQSLRHVVQTNLGAIDIKKYDDASIERKSDDNVKETEIVAGYDVSENATTEKYYRGIVEKEELIRLPFVRN